MPNAWENWYMGYLLMIVFVLKIVESVLILCTPMQADGTVVGPNRQDQQWVPYYDRPVAALFNYMYRQLE
ncbi:hypothetical protein Bbelb_285420 [Branchiostoma belcheri]|nr:hypothetical protein Bbelb_285420 [Branchiostoma belcheri]